MRNPQRNTTCTRYALGSVPTLFFFPHLPETGGVLIAPRPAPNDHTPKPGFPMRPFYGVQPLLVDEKVPFNCPTNSFTMSAVPLCTCEAQLTVYMAFSNPSLLCSLVSRPPSSGEGLVTGFIIAFWLEFQSLKLHAGLGLCKLANLVEFLI